MNWAYIIGGASFTLGVLALLFKLVLDRKEATIQKLNTDISSLQRQLSEAKDNTPDARAERLLKKIGILDKDIELLSKDYAKNEQELIQKVEELEKTNQELENLKKQVERTNELLDEASYYKEQFACPHCGAEVTTIAGEDEEVRFYSCGLAWGPSYNHPCPHDPDFPKLEEYELVTRQNAPDIWWCSPKPKTKMARMLTLDSKTGKTEEEARQNVMKDYQFKARNVPNTRKDVVI